MKSETEKLQSLILKVEEKKKSKSFYKEDYEEVEQFYEEITGKKPEPLSGRNPPIIRALKALELLKEVKNILEEKQQEKASEEPEQPEKEKPEEETPEELTDEDKKLNKNLIEHKEIIEQKIETAKLDSDINFDNIKKLIDNKNTNDGIIWVNSRVEDKRPIIEAVNEVRRRYGETGMITSNPGDLDDEPYVEYYLNTFKDLSDIKRYFNEYIYRNPNEQKPFKVCLTFGLIELDIKNLGTEIKKEDVEIILPHVNQRNNFEPCIVRNKATKKLFYEYIDKLIDQFIHDQASTNSGHVIIGLFSVCFRVYRLKPIGKYDREKLMYFIKSKYFRVPNDQYNFCWDAVAVMFYNMKMKDKDVNQKARRFAYKRIYGVEPNTASKEYKNFIRTYPGFDITNNTELKNFKDFYKVKIDIYTYDDKTKEYNLYFPGGSEEEEEEENEDYKLLSVLLYCSHAILMNPERVEMITKFLICPKCRVYAVRYNTKHGKARFDKHVEKCTGKFERNVNLNKISTPYCPHLLKNRVLLYCLAHDIPYEPITSYITFDFETIEEKIDKKITESTTINSHLFPLSVAATIKNKYDISTIYFDIRDGENFVDKFIDRLFIEAEQVSKSIFSNKPEFLNGELPTVPIIGFNSSKFDMNIMFSWLKKSMNGKNPEFLGSPNSFKQVIIQNGKVKLRFIDARLLAGGGNIKDLVNSFGDERAPNKGFFPYEAINTTNYMEVLKSCQPFKQEDFNSHLNQSKLSDSDYKIYLEDAKNFQNRWEYLQYYNELDTKIMISPIDNIIKMNWEYNVDALKGLSLSYNASCIKYFKCYTDFNWKTYQIHHETPRQYKRFVLTLDWWKKKVKNYLYQDQKKKRDTTNNLTEDDYEEIKKTYNGKCYLCGCYFTKTKKPTLDRIDNSKCHSLDNVKWCCKECNVYRKNKDEKITELLIKLHAFCIEKGLPMTIERGPRNDNRVYHILRNGIYGGLSTVHNRLNLKGKTHINKLIYDPETKTVKCIETENIMTHICGIDFNSLYPSSFASVKNPNIPYTGGVMYMPGRKTGFYVVGENHYEKEDVLRIINNRDELFVAEIKAHIPEKHINTFINFLPIIRRVSITTNEETIGSYMYKYLESNNLTRDTHETKLTELSKVSEFTAFSSYYLWFLMDTCHLVIDDIRSVITFSKHTGFNKFVTDFKDDRIKSIASRNKGREQFDKTTMNGSYGYDGKNTEKFNKIKVMNKAQTRIAQILANFVDTRKLNDENYLVCYKPKNFICDTCLQEALFTLDNAKFVYLNFIYNFMYKCFDMDKIHFIEGDTDSAYWAISGNPNEDFHQGFKYVIKDQEFYNAHAYTYFPKPGAGIEDEKKLLGLAIEKEGENMIALAPKCYTIFNDDEMIIALKAKGINIKKNKLTKDNYITALNEVVKGININLQLKDKQMSKLTIEKNALTGKLTKMKVLPNERCVPLFFKT